MLRCTSCAANEASLDTTAALLRQSLARRGPDVQGEVEILLAGAAKLHLFSAVLHLRGDACSKQPAISAENDALCWNGEVFSGMNLAPHESDTPAVMALISAGSSGSDISRSMANICGPYAFIFNPHGSHSVFFGRDPLGRRSLVYHLPSETPERASGAATAVISSVSVPVDGRNVAFTELPPLGVYELRIFDASSAPCSVAAACTLVAVSSLCKHSRLELLLWPWPPSLLHRANLLSRQPVPAAGDAMPFFTDEQVGTAAAELLRCLSDSVRVRVHALAPRGYGSGQGGPIERTAQAIKEGGFSTDHREFNSRALIASHGVYAPGSEPLASEAWELAVGSADAAGVPATDRLGSGADVAVLFSGGLDSMLLARLAHEHVPPSAPIDLINVCFAAPAHASPDRLAAIAGLAELRAACPGRQWRLVCVDESFASAVAEGGRVRSLVAPRCSHMDWNIGAALWFAARGIGYVDVDVAWPEGRGQQPAVTIGAPQGRASRHLRYGGAGPSAGASSAKADGKHSLNAFHGRLTAAGDDANAATPHDGPASTVASERLERALAGIPAHETVREAARAGGLATRVISREELEASTRAISEIKEAYLSGWRLDERTLAPEEAEDLAAVCYMPRGDDGDDGEEERPAPTPANAATDTLALDTPPAVSAAATVHVPPTAAEAPTADVPGGLPGTRHRLCAGTLIDGEPCTAPGSRKCHKRLCGACCKEAAARSPPGTDLCPLHAKGAVRLAEAARRQVAGVTPHLQQHGAPASTGLEPVARMATVGSSDVPVLTPPRATPPHAPPPPPTTVRLRSLARSSARVLLVGIGADEQLGGYARHRTVYAGTGGDWARLRRELAVDTARLWSRNLGRDDRVCSDHGREARFPFLDEGLMALLRGLPLPLLTDPRLPHGVGDKRLLRVAARMAGLAGCTSLVKRAIHFGSRIAKQSNVAAFGSNKKATGRAEWTEPPTIVCNGSESMS